jgi:hypothetical protein
MAEDGADPPQTTQPATASGGAGEIPYLIVLTGLGAGNIFRLEGELTAGLRHQIASAGTRPKRRRATSRP